MMPLKEFLKTPYFYHATPKIKPFVKFNTPEVWCDTLPTGYDSYGGREGEVPEGEEGRQVLIGYKWKKPFVTSVEMVTDYPEFSHISINAASANRAKYRSLGGESNSDSFEWMRKQGYDILVDDEGWCILHPERITIFSHDANKDLGDPFQIQSQEQMYTKLLQTERSKSAKVPRVNQKSLQRSTRHTLPGIKS
jgi:hypothetical protein